MFFFFLLIGIPIRFSSINVKNLIVSFVIVQCTQVLDSDLWGYCEMILLMYDFQDNSFSNNML